MQNSIHRFAGIVVLTSSGWLPGNKHLSLSIPQQVACANPRLMVSVDWTSIPIISRKSALSVCHLALDAAQYVLQFAIQQNTRIEPLVLLAPAGIGAERRIVSFSPPGSLRPVFVTRWHRFGHTMAANAVDNVAHEMFHILSGTEPNRRIDSANETLAYRVGTCAQLLVNGGVYLDSVVAAEVPDDVKPGAVRTSMAASHNRYKALLPLFGNSDWIPASSSSAKRLLRDCRSDLTSWFALAE